MDDFLMEYMKGFDRGSHGMGLGHELEYRAWRAGVKTSIVYFVQSKHGSRCILAWNPSSSPGPGPGPRPKKVMVGDEDVRKSSVPSL